MRLCLVFANNDLVFVVLPLATAVHKFGFRLVVHTGLLINIHHGGAIDAVIE